MVNEESIIEVDPNHHEVGSSMWFEDLCIVMMCVIMSSFMSGLTVGLASVDRLSLEIDAACCQEA